MVLVLVLVRRAVLDVLFTYDYKINRVSILCFSKKRIKKQEHRTILNIALFSDPKKTKHCFICLQTCAFTFAVSSVVVYELLCRKVPMDETKRRRASFTLSRKWK